MVPNTETSQPRMVTTGREAAYRVPVLSAFLYNLKIEEDALRNQTQGELALDVFVGRTSVRPRRTQAADGSQEGL